jgi:hypothetical protein
MYGNAWLHPIYIDDISITGIGGVSEAVLDTSYTHTLVPGESTDINISYIVPAVSGGEIAGGLEFTSNDPVNESGQYPISIFVNAPALSTIYSLEFSEMILGTDEVQDFPIYNMGTLDLVIDSITLSNTDYELLDVPTFPVTLSPGDSMFTSIRYPAYDVYSASADLTIYSNDMGDQTHIVSVSTTGTIDNFKIDLSEGWNIIAPVQTTPIATVIDSFSVVAPYTYYGWDGGMYNSIDTMYSGTGYWTLALEDGNIFVPNQYDVEEALPRTSLDSHESLQSLSQISFNNETYARTMYFGDYDYFSLPYETFLMPPVMSNIMFDVRYGDGSFLTTEEEVAINILASDMPITVSWQLAGKESSFQRRYLIVGDDQIDMDEVTSYTIEGSDIGGVYLMNRIIPDEFTLYPNYPNPFNPVTNISYGLSQDAQVRLVIYDIMGRVVNELYSGYNTSGMHTVRWHGDSQDGMNVASGVYIIHLYTRSDGEEYKSITNKCILLK